MQKLIAEVTECVEREYGRASAKFGPINNSDHESYAILLEELDESKDEIFHVEGHLNALWDYVKRNQHDVVKVQECVNIERTAILAACELIQVAAMAKKAGITICNRNASAELCNETVGDSV